MARLEKINALKSSGRCLSADSMILMKDGSQKRIDSITKGDQVQADETNSYLQVVDINTGREQNPCLRLTTDNNIFLVVTGEHPIMKQDGFCLAKELRIGDSVKTISGLKKIIEISEMLYDGMVYNMLLKSNENEDAAFYANGLVVGDRNKQLILMEKRREEALNPGIPGDLPEEWRRDITNARG